MKKWNVTIEAKNETEALEVIEVLKSTFELASKFGEPLHHIYADRERANKIKLVCEEIKEK